MNYTIEQWAHSANKDHTVMTWWTLTVDKTVRCESGVTFYTYSIPMYDGNFDENFHKWIHTAEHLIAYKQDTGSVRDSLEEVSWGTLDGKVILDISPYKTSAENFWFRITSMIPLPVQQVEALVGISISRAIDYLESEKCEDDNDFQKIPFARAISCGQFDFHDKKRAIRDLKNINIQALEISEVPIKASHQTAYVCDLRFLKPKLEWADDMVMFSPDFSYKISECIETYLPQELSGSIAIVWTFGCMTWMYLCISTDIWDESDISLIHSVIIKIIEKNIQRADLNAEEIIQLGTLLENYRLYK